MGLDGQCFPPVFRLLAASYVAGLCEMEKKERAKERQRERERRREIESSIPSSPNLNP